MKWLHLTDLHVGKSDNVTQLNALKESLKAIKAALEGQLMDLIILTGDLAYSGVEAEYTRFSTELLAGIRGLPACAHAKFLVVPGNHDIDCDAATPITWETLGKDRNAVFFEESDRGRKARAPRVRSMEAFAGFQKREGLLGLDPLREVSALVRIEAQGKSANFVLTNTVLFSDKAKENSDEAKAPSPLESIRTRFDATEPADYNVILGHYPIIWFRHRDREPFKSFLDDKRALYLHGHIHAIQAEYGPNGLRTLGYGAVYQAPLSAQSEPFYRNSFSICEIHEDHLHVAFWSWEPEYGRWIQTTALPAEFRDPSDRLSGGYKLRIQRPSKSTRLEAISRTPAPKPVRTPPSADRVTCLETYSSADWKNLVASGHLRLGIPSVTSATLSDRESNPGEFRFLCETSTGRHLIRCLPGPGNTLSQSQVESINTEFDFEGYDSYSIVSLGIMSEEARTLYLRLRTRKQLSILPIQDVARMLSKAMGEKQSSHIESLDGGEVSIELLLKNADLYVLIAERSRRAWYYVIDTAGCLLPEHELVVRLAREARPEITRGEYRTGAPGAALPITAVQKFDPQAYREACRKEFNSVRYAALASSGIRLTDVPLDELYVAASADVEEGANATIALSRAISDFLEGLQIDDHLRAKLEEQIRRQFRAGTTREGGAARKLYKQYPALLVLGDPGSGKTCFVKYEILAYCSPPKDEREWYSRHLPIFVPLSESAKVQGSGDLIQVACTLASKRGMFLDESYVRERLAAGECAFFFDGLDEVVSVNQRAGHLQEITQLVEKHFPKGNRFVITSRPAAVQLVDIPADLEVVHIRGLTPEEIRELASRVLAARVSTAHDGHAKLDLEHLSSDDGKLIERLLRDCETVPGIARLAKNPLLLTLLTMIYANGGPPAARRHRVYADAVQTLVSVRNRQPGQRTLPEADLRRRLGAIALSVYRDPAGTVPTRSTVIRVLRKELEESKGGSVEPEEATSFLQDVAESTGLLVIHGSEPGNGGAVSFMHHSFLEYYAALGLWATGYTEELPMLAQQPRWREVVTLLAGIVGEQGDVTQVVRRLLESSSPSDRITLRSMLFAFDCALECDVPPESAERLLLGALENTLASGAGLVDKVLRKDIGVRLGGLIAASGSPRALAFLSAGLRHATLAVRAAYVDLLGHATISWEGNAEILRLFDEACAQTDPVIVQAVLDAMGRAPSLRRDPSIEVLRSALSGNVTLRYAAVQVIEGAPGLARFVWDELIALMEDSRPYIAATAAMAVLKAGYRVTPSDLKSRQTTIRALARFQDSGLPADSVSDVEMKWELSTVEELLSSTIQDYRLLGLRLLPWVVNGEQFSKDRIMEILSPTSKNRSELVAALGALRVASGARRLLKISDLQAVVGLLQAETRDVRIATARLLGEFPGNPEAVEGLLKYVRQKSVKGEEHRQAVRSLSRIGLQDEGVNTLLSQQVSSRLSAGGGGDDEWQRTTIELLRALRELANPAADGFSSGLLSAIRSHRVPQNIRREALQTAVWCAQPNSELVNYLIRLLEQPPPDMGTSVCTAITDLVRRVRRRLDYVRAVYQDLAKLRDALIRHYERNSSSFLERSQEPRAEELRRSLEQIESLINSYGEFAARRGVEES